MLDGNILMLAHPSSGDNIFYKVRDANHIIRNHPKYADLCLPFKLSNFASKKQCSI